MTENALHALKQLILAKTEGTPFFMEEVVQTLVEEQILIGERGQYRLDHAVTDSHISPTVQGVLASRIDRLAPDEKALLQQLAVIGREFPLNLLRQVIPQSEDKLYRLLSSLQHKEFLYEQPAFPEVKYLFKHALTQEVAYNSVLIERRNALHEQTAQAIEQLYHGRLEEHYSELAHHYSRSGNTEKAIAYLHKAGQQAVQRSANEDAIRHLTTAIELLKTLPATSARDRQELTLQIIFGFLLRAAKGYAAPEVEQIYNRARELCQHIGTPSERFAVLRGLWGIYVGRGQLQLASELGSTMLELAQHEQDPTLLLEAHRDMGLGLLSQGNLAPARAHFEQAITLYDPQQHHALASLYAVDPGIDSRSWETHVLWYLGYPEQALQLSRETLALVHAVANRFNLASALVHASTFHLFRREGQLAQERAEAAMTMSTEYVFPVLQAWSALQYGGVLIEQGQITQAIAQLRQVITALQAHAADGLLPDAFARLAEAYKRNGQIQEGFDALAEASDRVMKTGRYLQEAELHRLKGELTLQKDSKEHGAGSTEQGAGSEEHGARIETNTQPLAPNTQLEAEACFLKAIEIAQKQQAKSLELRATVSLARLWQQQALEQGTGSPQHGTRTKLTEAHQMLSDIYNWFTEGFDTKDLQEAKALLKELSHCVIDGLLR